MDIFRFFLNIWTTIVEFKNKKIVVGPMRRHKHDFLRFFYFEDGSSELLTENLEAIWAILVEFLRPSNEINGFFKNFFPQGPSVRQNMEYIFIFNLFSFLVLRFFPALTRIFFRFFLKTCSTKFDF